MTIGEKIYELRKLKGLSQEELAEKLNVSRQSVSLWETNQTVPQIDYLMELSKIFNVTLDELCGNEENIDCSLNESVIKENEELLEKWDKEIEESKPVYKFMNDDEYSKNIEGFINFLFFFF